MLRPLTLATALATGLALMPAALAPLHAEETKMTQRTITLSASGTVTAVPDRVMITLGVMSEELTARQALDANTAAMRKVIDSLKAEGLGDRDVQTSDFSIGPRYEYYQDGKPPKLAGYQVSNLVNIRVTDIAKLGAILDKAVGEGSNQINGIRFEVSDADQRLDEARKTAVGNARRMAEIYATAAGAKTRPGHADRGGRLQFRSHADDAASRRRPSRPGADRGRRADVASHCHYHLRTRVVTRRRDARIWAAGLATIAPVARSRQACGEAGPCATTDPRPRVGLA